MKCEPDMPTAEQQKAYERDWRNARYERTFKDLSARFRTEVSAAKPILDFAGLLVLQTVSSGMFFAMLQSNAGIERKVIVCGFAAMIYWQAQNHAAPAAISISLMWVFSALKWLRLPHPNDWSAATFRAVSTATATAFVLGVPLVTGMVGAELAKASRNIGAQAEAVKQVSPPNGPPIEKAPGT